MFNKLFTFTILLVINWHLLFSQVTIGSFGSPVDGAILQLKQNENVGANSNLGLMLPRVTIIYPEDLTIDTNDKNKDYIGTVIYVNNNLCLDNKIMAPGIFVWDGDVWSPLSTKQQNVISSVWTTTDQDGNSFKAGRFKNQIWMLQNLKAKSFDTQSEAGFSFPSSPSLPSASFDPSKAASWCYTGPAGGTGLDPTFVNTYPEFGLLYSWILATGNKNKNASLQGTSISYNNISQRAVGGITSIVGADEVEKAQLSYTGRSYIQGVCPNGWRLPSDRDFLILENELFSNPENYSYISNVEQDSWTPNTWQSEWNKFTNYNSEPYQSWRSSSGNNESSLAQVMKTSCFPPLNIDNSNYILGKSLSMYDGGFNATPTGDATATGLRRYGEWTFIMTSSFTALDYQSNSLLSTSTPKYVARAFIFTNNLAGYESTYSLVGNGNPNLPFNFATVRCVYNNDSGFQIGMPEDWGDLF